MTAQTPGTLLVDDEVIEDPCPFSRRLQANAHVTKVPDREVFSVSPLALLADAVAPVDDFTTKRRALLHRDKERFPGHLAFGDAGVDAVTADPSDHKIRQQRSPLRVAQQ